MSRIHRFIGSIDAPTPGENVVHALVFGITPGTPLFGFVTIPLKCISTPREQLRDGDKIEGRMCPRSIRVWVTGHRPPDFQRWLHHVFAPQAVEDVQALDRAIREDSALLYATSYEELLDSIERKFGADHGFVDILGFVYGDYERRAKAGAEKVAALTE